MTQLNHSQEIQNLLHRYADAVDSANFTLVGEMFANGGIYDPSGNVLAHGFDEVLAFYSSVVRVYDDDKTPHTHHLVSHFILENIAAIGGHEVANTKASYTVFQKLKSGDIKTIMCGQYQSVFKHQDNGWAFSEHHMHPKLVGDMSEHLLFEMNL